MYSNSKLLRLLIVMAIMIAVVTSMTVVSVSAAPEDGAGDAGGVPEVVVEDPGVDDSGGAAGGEIGGAESPAISDEPAPRSYDAPADNNGYDSDNDKINNNNENNYSSNTASSKAEEEEPTETPNKETEPATVAEEETIPETAAPTVSYRISTQDATHSVNNPKTGDNTWLYIGIGNAAVGLIAVIITYLSTKKQKT